MEQKKNNEQRANSSEKVDFMIHSVVCYEMSRKEAFSFHNTKLDVKKERDRVLKFYTRKQSKETILKHLRKKQWNIQYLIDVLSKTTDLKDPKIKSGEPKAKKFNALPSINTKQINDHLRERTHELTRFVAELWGVNYIDLFKKNKSNSYAFARFFMFWWLTDQGVGSSNIARFYLKNHATVINGLKKHNLILSHSPEYEGYAKKFDKFKKQLEKYGY